MKPGRKTIELDIETLKKDYESVGLVELATKYGVSSTTIWRQLKAAGVEMRSVGFPLGKSQEKVIKLTEDQVIEAAINYIENSANTTELALKYGVSSTTIWRQLKAAGVEMRSVGFPMGKRQEKLLKLTEDQVVEIAVTYIENPKISLRELARRHNANHENKVSHETVRKELINAGVELRSAGRPHANLKKSAIIQPPQERKSYRLVTNDLTGLFSVPEKSLRRRIKPQTLCAGRGRGRCVPS